jgi:hypothetical protein
MAISNPARPWEHFPFMKLPPEIRLMVYEIAMQDTIATASSIPVTQLDVKEPSQPRLGALALAYTSDLIRTESSEVIFQIANSQFEISLIRQRAFQKAWSCLLASSDGFSLSDEIKRETYSPYYDALIQTHWIGRLCQVLIRAL